MRREEGEKISLRFPQTFEAAALVSIYINCKESWELVVVPVRKPLDGAYAPSVAARAAGLFFYAQKTVLFAQNKKRRPVR
jgi:hypothetical protein